MDESWKLFWKDPGQWLKGYLEQLFGLDLLWDRNSPAYDYRYQQWANPQGWVTFISMTLTTLFGILVCYKSVYMIMGLLGKSKTYSSKPMKDHYAFVISARNEEKVIGNLIDSIWNETYPKELIDIIVVADNCDPDDKTAKICRDKGCLVYERHDMSKVRKGYALQWLFERLNKEMDITKYTGFVVMDADNVVSPNFMEKMNDVFLENYDCVRSYLNVKNMNENWIAGVSGINWYRAAVFAQRPRSMLNTCQQTCGTGFLIRSQLLTQGWPYLELAEDSEMMTHLVAQNKRIGFCEAAEIYDEQPTTLKVALRQRFRWAKGGIVNWAKNNWRILGSFIKKPTWSKYDIWWEIFPYGLVTFLFGLATTIASTVIQVSTGGNAWGSVTNYLLSITVFTYLGGWVQGVLILIKERKRVHLNFGEAVLDSFLWPFFDMIFIPISIASLFVRVGWKHTPHHVVKDPEKLVEEENARERAEEEKKANKARAIKAAAEKKDIKESDPD